MFLDAIRIKIRENHQVATRAAHIGIGVDMDKIKHVLGIWIDDNEGASLASVCAQLANRGIKDVLIVAVDGLKGLPEAIEATWPQAMVHTCVVHLIRAATRFVAYADRKAVSVALRKIYTAPDEQVAKEELEAFARCELGRNTPQRSRPGKMPGSVSHHFYSSRQRFARSFTRPMLSSPSITSCVKLRRIVAIFLLPKRR